MRQVIGSVLLVGLAVAPAIGQQAKGKKVNGPSMELTPAEHDFGTVEQNLRLEKEFEVTNVGTEDLVIGRISTSCGCTAALTSDKVVKPDESTTLKVTLETRKYKGQIQRSVSIASNDPRRIKTVKVKAFVRESKDEPSPKR